MDSPAAILVGLVISLFISSFLIASIVVDKENVQLSSFEPSILGIGNYIDEVKFNNTAYCEDYKDQIEIYMGNWSCSELGLVSNSESFITIISGFYFPNSIPSNNVYDTTYYINNSIGSEFDINVRIRGSRDIAKYQDIKVSFNIDKIRIPNNILYGLSDIEIDYPGILSLDYLIIRTIFDEGKDELDLIVNGKNVLTDYETNDRTPLVDLDYGGIEAYNNGLILENAKLPLEVSKTSSVDTSILRTIGSIWTLVLQVMVWTIPETYFPLWANLLFIKTQVIGIIIAGLAVLRG
jgi:hypothetical protein